MTAIGGADLTAEIAAAQRSCKHTRQYLHEHRLALSRVAVTLTPTRRARTTRR